MGWTSRPPKRSIQLVWRWLRSGFEKALGHVFALRLEVFHSHREEACRGVVPDGLAFRVDTDLLELEELLELDFAILDAHDLGHAHDAANAAAQPGLLDDQVDRGPDRLADGSGRQVLTSLEHQRLEPDQRLMRVVGVQRRHRTIMARVHRLQHVQGFAAATLTDDDAVGSHTQAALDELANWDGTLALDVGRTRLELDPVRLLELKLRGVLARDQALGLWDEGREDVEQRGLT